MGDLPLLISCFLFLLLSLLASSQSEPGIIHTSTGPVQGSTVNVDGHTIYRYLGIPYAQPPLGDLRFKRPQPVQPWTKTLKATKMPPACIQYAVLPFPWYDFEDGKSEDCLYLNIWVPDTKDNISNKTVMFWIHGGSLAYGSIRLPLYEGRTLAAYGDVIVVTINYRLGAFGFFTTNTDAAPVNNALYDMLEALKWVNKNIAAFGGDPNQVTIFGESAGSWAVGWFCVSPLTKGLFNRAIMESGSPANIQFDVNTTSLEISQKLAEALECADPLINSILTSPDNVADCMKGKEAFEIAKTLNSFNPNTGQTYNAVAGKEFLPETADEALKAGKFHNVSLLIGNNRDEGSIFLTSFFPDVFGFFGQKLPQLDSSVAGNLFNKLLQKILKDVPGAELITHTILGSLNEDDYRKNLKIIYDILGDFMLVCPDIYFAESYSQYGQDVYFYFFKHRPSATPWAEWMGVVHFEEIQFAFGSPLKERNKYTNEEVKLSKLMMKIWSDFAKYGDPFYDESKERNSGSEGLLQSSLKLNKWPVYSRETPLYLILDKTTRKAKRYSLGPHKANCDLLRAISKFP